ncbi:Rfa2p [Rhodotorula paludigena]|uniref:Replication protein A C-terminal domain-containing protein n=1 Tax=Rhodotorula paludigena TaxID=86838 RepID=A0AAV5GII1_9BASI|nr:hypothetical protein Rhopal_001444-T1 [Rhodotorula paludigena]
MSGGGFLASQGGSQSSPGGGAKGRGNQALRPVTIHQILNATQAFQDSEFYIDDAEVKDVTLVVCIRNIATAQTNITMLVEDGTGQIDARTWKDPQDETPQEDYPINSYVRIIGQIKTFSNKRHLNVNRIRRVEDQNEVLFHAVEAIYVHKYYSEGPPGGAGGVGALGNAPYNGGAANPYANGGETSGGGGETYSDLPTLQRSIMQTVLANKSDEGVNINAILRAVGGDPDRVRMEYQQLIDEGHLYQTIDDDHVLPTAS